MYSYVKFYEKDNELHEIHFLVWLGGITPGEISNTSDFNENKNITTRY